MILTIRAGMRFMVGGAVAAGLALAPAAASHFRGQMYNWRTAMKVDLTSIPHTPDEVTGLGPQFKSVPGTLAGNPVVIEKVTFLDTGGVTVNGPAGFNFTLNGPRLYEGDAADPEFTVQKGFLFDPATGAMAGRFGIVAVPEPGNWALMLAGFALVGASLRRRQPVPA